MDGVDLRQDLQDPLAVIPLKRAEPVHEGLFKHDTEVKSGWCWCRFGFSLNHNELVASSNVGVFTLGWDLKSCPVNG